MFWQDEPREERVIAGDDVVDIVFQMHCRALPVDHSYALAMAIRDYLPWFGDETGSGLHAIHVAASQNGWMRPEKGDALLYPSRRTRMKLRAPRQRIDEVRSLEGKQIDVLGHELNLMHSEVQPLLVHPAVFARYLVVDGYRDEAEVLQFVVEQLRVMGIKPRKLMCGTETVIRTPESMISTRSLMAADLEPAEALELQKRGIGRHQWLGCGVFIPHKDIKEISPR